MTTKSKKINEKPTLFTLYDGNKARNRQLGFTDAGVKEVTEMGKGQSRVEPTIGFQRLK